MTSKIHDYTVYVGPPGSKFGDSSTKAISIVQAAHDSDAQVEAALEISKLQSKLGQNDQVLVLRNGYEKYGPLRSDFTVRSISGVLGYQIYEVHGVEPDSADKNVMVPKRYLVSARNAEKASKAAYQASGGAFKENWVQSGDAKDARRLGLSDGQAKRI